MKKDKIFSRLSLIALCVIIFAIPLITSCKLLEEERSNNKKNNKKVDKKKDNTPQVPLGDKQLQIHMLDVGQGDSLLIITPENKSVLIDAGLARAGDKVVQALAKYNITQIDLAVASHPHADHIGGMPKVLNAIKVKRFLDSGQEHPTQTYERLLTTVKDKIGSLIIARTGKNFDLDSGIRLEVLGPSEPLLENVSGSDENANSVIIKLTYGNFKMLFTGDSEDETEERLLSRNVDLSAQVLKVAHHGSNYATTEKFLDKVKPEVGIISCGEDNDYGHPAPNTLDRLKSANVKVYRTDLEGEITITSDGNNYNVTTEHESTGDIWKGRTTASKSKK